MQEAASSRRLYLSYRMGLTLVFREFGVLLEGEAFKELLHTDTYDDQSFHRMGYQKIGGHWMCRASDQEHDSDLDRDDAPAEAGLSKAPTDIAPQPSKPVTPPAHTTLDTAP